MKIAVIGSCNIDFVVESDRLPERGETLTASTFFTSPGGKGANQAVASAKLGGDVTFFGSVGNDPFGDDMLDAMNRVGIDTTYVQRVEEPTGIALIQLAEGDNRITVVPGANERTDRAYLDAIRETLATYDMIVMQLEIPMQTVETVVERAEAHQTILIDPAPAARLARHVLDRVDYLLPNETEYAIALQTNRLIEETLVRTRDGLLITRGGEGVSYNEAGGVHHVAPEPVDVIDTTGAGDTFAGAFAVALSEQMTLHEAVRFANRAGAQATTKKGAQEGMPRREQIDGTMDDTN